MEANFVDRSKQKHNSDGDDDDDVRREIKKSHTSIVSNVNNVIHHQHKHQYFSMPLNNTEETNSKIRQGHIQEDDYDDDYHKQEVGRHSPFGVASSTASQGSFNLYDNLQDEVSELRNRLSESEFHRTETMLRLEEVKELVAKKDIDVHFLEDYCRRLRAQISSISPSNSPARSSQQRIDSINNNNDRDDHEVFNRTSEASVAAETEGTLQCTNNDSADNNTIQTIHDETTNPHSRDVIANLNSASETTMQNVVEN